MNRLNQMEKVLLSILVSALAIAGSVFGGVPASEKDRPDVALESQKKTISDKDGEVTVTLEFLNRPGEFALTIHYFGYLTQEGPVNCWLEVNGIQREFVTLSELPDRSQQVKILSFHPSVLEDGVNRLRELGKDEMVDYLLFRNAPYFPQLGNVKVALKFFANGRWDGDGNHENDNYRFEFTGPATTVAFDHF